MRAHRFTKQERIDRLLRDNRELTDRLMSLLTFLRLNYPEVRRAYFTSLLNDVLFMEGKLNENLLAN